MMKKLSIEEKAKAYDEAKLRMSRAFNSNRCTIGFMNEIFPELRENWDEKIRTKLIEFFSGYNTDEKWWGSITEKDILAWLEKQGDIPADAVLDSNKDGLIADTIRCKIEKQGEQKPTEWSEEDEYNQAWIVEMLYGLEDEDKEYEKKCRKMADWLKSLKYRVQPQPKQEWSEEDEDNLNSAIYYIRREPYRECDVEPIVDWLKNKLKSLRPQNWTKEDKERYISCLQRLSTGNPEQPETINSKWFKEHVYPKLQWKPSDKQIYSLDRVLSFYGKGTVTYDFVKELLEQLKKL